MADQIQPPAPRPCTSCPYRRDAPSGLWAAEEYAKLVQYDKTMGEQPQAVFLCHQFDHDAEARRVCAGWAGCHNGDDLLALRVAVFAESMTPETAHEVREFVSPVPLFTSGAEAAVHGLADIRNPGPEARAAMAKIERVRGDLRT